MSLSPEQALERSQKLESLRRRAGYSMDDLAKAMDMAGSSSIQRYLARDYLSEFRPDVTKALIAALVGVGDPKITVDELSFLGWHPNELAERICYRLLQVNKSASAAALEAGLGRSSVRDIILGSAQHPRIDTLQKLTGPLQCSIHYLVEALDGGKEEDEEWQPACAETQKSNSTHAAEAVLAIAASQWDSVPTPQQIVRALAAGGFKIVEANTGALSETLRSLSAGKHTLEVGARIAAMRQAKGLTQETLSEKLGCHWITVSKLENNRMDLTVEWLLRIADALEVDVSALLKNQMSGEDIRTTREGLGWSQNELAQRAGTTQQTVDRVERNETEFSRARPAIIEALQSRTTANAIDDPLSFVREILERRKVAPNALAAKVKISGSTLTRALNNPDHKFTLSTTTLRKIKEWDNAQA